MTHLADEYAIQLQDEHAYGDDYSGSVHLLGTNG